jgi:hypothetical protein
MIALLLSLVLALPGGHPVRGVASWYGSVSDRVCHQGLPRTCTPYLSGEQVMYAAVGTWRWGDTPYRLKVCRADDVRVCVLVVVRDYCARCDRDGRKAWHRNSRAIDLSPAAFKRLERLSTGLVRVVLFAVGGR